MVEIAYNAPANIKETETENGLIRSVVVQRTTKDGQIVNKEIFTPAVVEAYENIDYLRSLKDVSEKGLVFEIGDLDDEMLKKEGFKGGVMDFIGQVFGTSLALNTVQKYRKIGKVFGVKTIDDNGKIHYSWKAPIADDVSVTNLTQIIGLLNLPKDYAKLTEAELDKVFQSFVVNYIVTGKIHLDATNKILRDEITAIKTTVNDIQSTATEIKDGETVEEGNTVEPSETADEVEITPEIEAEEKRTHAIEMLDYLKVYFKGNKDALKAIATLVKIIG